MVLTQSPRFSVFSCLRGGIMTSSLNYEEIVYRAHMFNYLENLIKKWSELGVPIKCGSDSAQRLSQLRIPELPKVLMVDSKLYCDDVAIDLSAKPLMLKLFIEICEVPGQMLHRDKLARKVYDLGPDVSRRRLESCHNNLIKVISRARRVVEGGIGPISGVSWFVFHHESKVWSLFQVNQEYIQPTTSLEQGLESRA
jgi:hypothetical protein